MPVEVAVDLGPVCSVTAAGALLHGSEHPVEQSSQSTSHRCGVIISNRSLSSSVLILSDPVAALMEVLQSLFSHPCWSAWPAEVPNQLTVCQAVLGQLTQFIDVEVQVQNSGSLPLSGVQLQCLVASEAESVELPVEGLAVL